MMGKTDWTSSFNTSKRLVSLPLTSSSWAPAESLLLEWWWWPEMEEGKGGDADCVRMVQLQRARTPSPSSELSRWWSTLTARSHVNSSWLRKRRKNNKRNRKSLKEKALQKSKTATRTNNVSEQITNLGWWGWVETEKLRTAETAAAMCLPLTSKLSDQAGFVVCVEMIFRPFLTLALSKKRKINHSF